MSRFKILWIDDQRTKCKKDVGSVSKIIQALGFEPDIQIEDDISTESINRDGGRLKTAIQARDIDLFVIDYNLKNNIFGTDLIEEIRMNNNIFTDIVFYSSDPESLINTVKESFNAASIMNYFDGVYIAPLTDEFSEKMLSVITKIVKSWYNIHSIRGIVLSKASKFEQLVTNIINDNYRSCLDKLNIKLAEKAENVCRSTKVKWDCVKKATDPIPQILNDPIQFNWKVKEMLLKTLCDEKIIDLSTWKDIISIFKLRNDFAHNPIHLRDGILVLTTSKGEQLFSEDRIDEIREQLTRIETDLHRIMPSETVNLVIPENSDEQNIVLCEV